MQLKHGAESEESGPWEVEVDQTTTKYGDFESIDISAIISSEDGTVYNFPLCILLSFSEASVIY